MLEEHTYFSVLHMIWVQEDVYSQYGPRLFKDIPTVMRGAVCGFLRSIMSRDLYGQVPSPIPPPPRPHLLLQAHTTGTIDVAAYFLRVLIGLPACLWSGQEATAIAHLRPHSKSCSHAPLPIDCNHS